MYYEEKVINGVLHCRTIPHGEWTELTKEHITQRLIETKKELISATTKLTVLEAEVENVISQLYKLTKKD